MSVRLVYLNFLTLYFCYVSGQSGQLVETNVGQIEGLASEDFVAFFGIPYGKVNESNPFQAAKPQPKFKTTYRAFTEPPVCPQNRKGIIKGSIQCLNLNIYTPHNITQTSKLPVMVFIHGGGFIDGDSNLHTMSPKFLVKNNVIIVTVIYRVGPYGFFCLPELGYSNQGINDIILALKWVKDNINGFGGDYSNILLFGHSSGSVCVDLILLHNKNNVFNKVIMQSAQAISPFILEKAANGKDAVEIAEKLGIKTENLTTIDLINKLSLVDTDLLIKIMRDYTFRPCVDNVLIADRPRNTNFTDTKILVGTTTEEILYFYKYNDHYTDNIQNELNKEFNNITEYGINLINNFYLKDDIRQNVNDFGNDYAFNYPAKRTINYYLNNKATVYRYLFSYDGGHNYIKVRDNLTDAGASHGDELGYLFDMYMPDTERDTADQFVTDAMTKLWTNFAKYGDPTPKFTELVPVKWPAVEQNHEYYLNINSSLSVQEGLYTKRMAFWDRFYQNFGYLSKGFHYG